MNQLKLQDFEKKLLENLYERNYANSGIICDVALADKLKKREKEINGR